MSEANPPGALEGAGTPLQGARAYLEKYVAVFMKSWTRQREALQFDQRFTFQTMFFNINMT